jgi:hypothetical protein
MSEHKHTEFLKHCLRYDDSSHRHQLEKDLTRIQRDVHCVQRAVWLMGILAAVAVCGLMYPTILLNNFPHSSQHLIVSLVCALFVGSLISMVTFMVLGMIYRRQLRKQREVCGQMVKRLLATRLGEGTASPPTTIVEDSRVPNLDPKFSGPVA